MKIDVCQKLYKFLKETTSKVNLLYGGAGSAKSWSIAQYLIFEKLLKERNITILVVRKTLPAVKRSCLELFRNLLQQYDIAFYENKSENIIYVNGNKIIFLGLDDPEKTKSIERIHYIWIEEATELLHNEFLQLLLRARASNVFDKNKLFLSFNPISEHNYLRRYTDNPPESYSVIHSTYKDNPFLDDQYKKTLESLQDQDEEYYNIYALGEWGTLKNIIYDKWDLVDELPKVDESLFYYGLDFGFENASALVKCYNNETDLWVDEILYRTGLTNKDLIDNIKPLILNLNNEIYCDSAEPARIKEMCDEPSCLNAFQSDKSVKDGIDYVKRFKIHVTKRSLNIIKELQMYKRKADKNGNVLEDPVRFNDHAVSAIRYAVYTQKQKVEPRVRYIG